MIKYSYIALAIFSLVTIVKSTNDAKKGFLATFPSSVIPGDTAQFCIRFFNINENIIIKITEDVPEFFEPIRESISTSKIKIKFEK